MSFSYIYILTVKKKKGKLWILGQRHRPNHVSYGTHYVLTWVDNTCPSPEACHDNIDALGSKSLSLFLHPAEACKFIEHLSPKNFSEGLLL